MTFCVDVLALSFFRLPFTQAAISRAIDDVLNNEMRAVRSAGDALARLNGTAGATIDEQAPDSNSATTATTATTNAAAATATAGGVARQDLARGTGERGQLPAAAGPRGSDRAAASSAPSLEPSSAQQPVMESAAAFLQQGGATPVQCQAPSCGGSTGDGGSIPRRKSRRTMRVVVAGLGLTYALSSTAKWCAHCHEATKKPDRARCKVCGGNEWTDRRPTGVSPAAAAGGSPATQRGDGCERVASHASARPTWMPAGAANHATRAADALEESWELPAVVQLSGPGVEDEQVAVDWSSVSREVRASCVERVRRRQQRAEIMRIRSDIRCVGFTGPCPGQGERGP